MSNVIWTDKISKQYRIDHANPTLREHLQNLFTLGFLREKPPAETMWALQDVSLSIKRGEAVGIIGRNGAGKSTLLKVLCKITYPTSGTMGVQGRVASLLEVGTGFHEELTGRENIFMNGSILGMPKKEVRRQFDAIVEYSGVEKFIDMPIKRYSSGMRLRLGFAVAAHLEPDVLIIDEVLAVGDAAFQKKCLETIYSLRASARTILFVSHNLTAVESLCERCIWIDNGQVREDGEGREVIRHYMASLSGPKPTTTMAESTQRRGGGQIRFNELEFLSADGVAEKIIRAGDSVVMRFHYTVNEEVAYPSFGFRMYTELGTLVTETSTSHHNIYLPTVTEGDGYLDLEIDSLNLLPAKYIISLWVTDMSGAVIYDNIEQAVTMEVESANVYESGLWGVDSRFGIVFFPQKWNLAGVSMRDDSTAGRPADSKQSLPR